MTTAILNFIWNTYRKPELYVIDTSIYVGKLGKYIITFKDFTSVEVVMTKQQRCQLWRTRINKDILKVDDLGYVRPK